MTSGDALSEYDAEMLRSIVLLTGRTSAALAEECAKRGDRIKELKSLVDRRVREIVDCNTMVAKKDRRIFDLESHGRMAENTIKQLEAKIVQQSSHIQSMFDLIDRRDDQIKQLEKSNVRLTHKAEGLEDENAGLIKVISRGQGVDHTRLEECRQSNRDLKTIAANSESYTHRMDELVASCKSDAKQQDRRLKDLISANGALAADVRSCEGVRTKNRELNSRVDELEAELNDMSREMSNRCVCSGCAGSQRLELLDDIEKIVNPIIKSGEYAHSVESARVLAQAMWDLCHCLIDFRRKHNIIG